MAAGKLAQAFIQGMGLTAVYAVGRVRFAEVQVTVGSEPPRLAVGTWWCSRQHHAQLIAASIEPHNITRDNASTVIRATAERLTLLVADDETVRSIGVCAAEAINQVFEAGRRAGQLQQVNRAFADYRRTATAAGRGAKNYPSWLFDIKLRVAKLAGETSIDDRTRPFGGVDVQTIARSFRAGISTAGILESSPE